MKYLIGTIVILFTFLIGAFVGARSILSNIDRYVTAPAPVVTTIEVPTTKYIDRVVQVPAPVAIPYHKATYDEVVQFLKDDNTNQKTYNVNTFDCKDFAAMLKSNANDKGIMCAVASMDYISGDSSVPVNGHTINAFDTSDRDIIYVEPQLDIIVPGVARNADYDYLLNYARGTQYAKDITISNRITHITLTW